MGVLDRLKAWMTVPAAETATYRCTNCSLVVDEAELACPDCGGSVEQFVHEPIDLYWPHH